MNRGTVRPEAKAQDHHRLPQTQSGDYGRPYKMSWQSIKKLMRYFSPDRGGGGGATD